MDVFGFAPRALDFDPDHGDVGLRVEFTPGSQGSSWGPYFEFKEGLEALLEWPVDLVEACALCNPYILAAIEGDHQPVNGAWPQGDALRRSGAAGGFARCQR